MLPPNYNEILLDVRQSHKPVILEGQSGTGKTSCVRHILTELDAGKKPEYLTARDPFHVRTIENVVSAPSPGSYVIDDFHRLSIDLQEQIAHLAKLSADMQRPDLPKLIIIGMDQDWRRNSFNSCPTSQSTPASIASRLGGARTSTSSFKAGANYSK